MMMATSMLLGACTANSGDGTTGKAQTDGTLIGRSTIKIADGRMTPEALWAFGRIGDYQVSPDGQLIVYTLSLHDALPISIRSVTTVYRKTRAIERYSS